VSLLLHIQHNLQLTRHCTVSYTYLKLLSSTIEEETYEINLCGKSLHGSHERNQYFTVCRNETQDDEFVQRAKGGIFWASCDACVDAHEEGAKSDKPKTIHTNEKNLDRRLITWKYFKQHNMTWDNITGRVSDGIKMEASQYDIDEKTNLVEKLNSKVVDIQDWQVMVLRTHQKTTLKVFLFTSAK
jgi:hypothetical protein